ncbi:wiskott-Aldrich syndrome protein homolog [Falco naumanni]|uniref:wiskott-Aldrich syndrome protein homolog n=1 Tax=Falco naumanni TaxID=148594 RepID=UPI001ADE69CF|nr:wiskott-Aldrich syndrome protein homolog [Falco naumanni]
MGAGGGVTRGCPPRSAPPPRSSPPRVPPRGWPAPPRPRRVELPGHRRRHGKQARAGPCGSASARRPRHRAEPGVGAGVSPAPPPPGPPGVCGGGAGSAVVREPRSPSWCLCSAPALPGRALPAQCCAKTKMHVHRRAPGERSCA